MGLRCYRTAVQTDYCQRVKVTARFGLFLVPVLLYTNPKKRVNMELKNFNLLLILSLLWGGSFYFIAKALLFLSYEQIVFFRVFFAALTLFGFLLLKRVKFDFDWKLWLSFLVMGILNNVIPFLAFTYAQNGITASMASLFNATTPIFVASFAHLLTKDEKLSKLKILGITIGFLGIVFLLNPHDKMVVDSYKLIALIAPISYAFAGIFGKILKGKDPIFSAFGMLTCSSLIMYLFFHTTIHTVNIEQFEHLKHVVFLAIFSTAIAYILYFKLLARVGATKLLLVTFLIPISASILGVLLLNEAFTPTMYLGMMTIFIALFLIIKDKK